MRKTKEIIKAIVSIPPELGAPVLALLLFLITSPFVTLWQYKTKADVEPIKPTKEFIVKKIKYKVKGFIREVLED